MSKKDYKYIYGPVPSWRLGSSLGVDPISAKEKICSFSCSYCQLGPTKNFSMERKVYVHTEDVMKEIETVPDTGIDYITFSGAGEPSLALNLGNMIRGAKKIRKEKTAVITNSSLMYMEEVMKDLSNADFVLAKLDAASEAVFKAVNKPMRGIGFETVLMSLAAFRRFYKGRMALQIMFVKGNKQGAAGIAEAAARIAPDEVQLNTPLRDSAENPLTRDEMEKIEALFVGMNVVSVYKAEKKEVKSLSDEDTLKRRGKVVK